MPRPSTLNMMNAPRRPTGPSSPPQTPKSASSPSLSKLGKQQARGDQGVRDSQAGHQQQSRHSHRQMPNRRSAIHPLGNGTSFSYRPDSLRPNQLSPRSSSSSSGEESGSDSSTSDSPPRSLHSEHSRKSTPLDRQPETPYERNQTRPETATRYVRAARIVVEETIVVEDTLVVEEVPLDFNGSDDDTCKVLRPYLIEYADSERSRSRSRNPPAELDRKVVTGLRDLAFPSSDEDQGDEDEESDIGEAEYEKLLLRRREERRQKRMSSGSISKRTISERGSDSDREDLLHGGLLHQDPTTDQTGGSRRIRRRVGNRHSLQFQDPPHPRIDELDEPDSSEEILDDAEILARELPYYDYVSMQVDSP